MLEDHLRGCHLQFQRECVHENKSMGPFPKSQEYQLLHGRSPQEVAGLIPGETAVIPGSRVAKLKKGRSVRGRGERTVKLLPDQQPNGHELSNFRYNHVGGS